MPSSIYKVHPTWSEGRHRWLSRLASEGRGILRGSGSVGSSCRALGWVDWDKGAGAPWQVLTQAGVEVLAKWDAGDRGAIKPTTEASKSLAKRWPAEVIVATLSLAELANALGPVREADMLELLKHRASRWPLTPGGGAVPRVDVTPAPAAVCSLCGCVDHDPECPSRILADVLKPCPIKFEIEPPKLREGAPTECDQSAFAECPAAIDAAKRAGLAMPFSAPDLAGASDLPRVLEPGEPVDTVLVQDARSGYRQNFANNPASIGTVVNAANAYSQCPRCHGKGVTGHSLQCISCKGAGTVQRTVAP